MLSHGLASLADFHFLRPLWFLALLPAIWLLWHLGATARAARQWQMLIQPQLLKHLIDNPATELTAKRQYGRVWLGLGLVIAIIALAGPTWEKRPSGVAQNAAALVIVLDLSPSMLSQDLKPTRATRAQLKITDILKLRRDGQTALIAYAGDAHVVAPLTQDTNNIQLQLSALTPAIMPLPGSNTEAALAQAQALIANAGLSGGEILLITDGVDEAALDNLREVRAQFAGIRLQVLGLGSDSPTPIPSSRGGFLRDPQGAIATTRLDSHNLAALAALFNGRFHRFTDSDTDINYLLGDQAPEAQASPTDTERQFDLWYDQGRWLILLLLPGLLYAFRRGLLSLAPLGLAGVISIGALAPVDASAQSEAASPSSTSSWFLNRNQRGVQALKAEDTKTARELLTDPQWQAAADYRAGDYEAAAQGFSQDPSARGQYNLGNTLAQLGQWDKAIESYDHALALDPDLEDARNNRALIEELKRQQEQNQQQNQEQNQEQQQNDAEQNSDKSENSQAQDSQQQDGQQQDEKQQDGQQESETQNSADQQSGEQQQDQQQNDASDAEPSSEEQKRDQAKNQQEQTQGQDSSQQQIEGQASSSESQEQTRAGTSSSAASEDESASGEAEQQAEQQSQNQTQQQAEQQAEQQAQQQAQAAMVEDADGLTGEERQALEQWLRKVPDEPGMLLRNKFRDQYETRRQQMYNNDWTAPENGAAERL